MTAGLLRRAALVSIPSALVLLVPAPAPAQQSTLVPFEIKDQFDRVHRHSDYAEQILIVIGSDRNGSEFHDDWESALRDSLAADSSDVDVAFLSVAEVRGVPFFLKGTVKGKFSREEDEWILLDWKGFLAETYGFEANSANILVFAADGTLAMHVHGRELDFRKLSVILATLRQAQSDAQHLGQEDLHARKLLTDIAHAGRQGLEYLPYLDTLPHHLPGIREGCFFFAIHHGFD